jgi:uncharacterized protein YwqG
MDDCRELVDISEEGHVALRVAFDTYKKTTLALSYQTVDETTALTASRCGGEPFKCVTSDFDWPCDKNRNPMQFLAQLNFGEFGGVENCPAGGILMLFISRDYQSFRPKDQSWYRLMFKNESAETAAVSREDNQYSLSAKRVEYLPEECMRNVVLAVRTGEQDYVEAWLKALQKDFEAEMADCQQVLGIASKKASEAAIMAAFHTNGITFDQTRKADPSYSHLVDYAKELVVLWRLGGMHRFFPAEKRDLFICINREDLIKNDFVKCSPVFL